MTTATSTDDSVDFGLGVLLSFAMELDREWMKAGSCYNWGSKRPGHPTPWQVSPKQTVSGVSGTEMMRYAQMICFACPAQYDCLKFAVEGRMIAGTWAVRAKTLQWFQQQEDALDLIEMAREKAIPVQTLASKVMAERLNEA